MIKPTMRICTFLLAAGLMIATAGMKVAVCHSHTSPDGTRKSELFNFPV